MYFRGKKGQIVIFIIVGIILLIGVSSFFYFRGVSVRDTFEEGTQRVVTERVSSDFRPVQEFVTSCVREVAKEGVIRIGRHGGYAYSEDLTADRFNPTSLRADSIYLFPTSDQHKVSYWWHMDSDDSCLRTRSCTFNSKRPPLANAVGSIEDNLERYIEKEIHNCLDGYNFFVNNGYVIDELSEPSAEVTITSNDVYVEFTMPLNAQVDNRESRLNYYNTYLDVNIRGIYEVASIIRDLQADSHFLESQLIELISLHSGTSRDALLPPFFDPYVLKMQGNHRSMWTRTEVKSVLMSMLASYVPMFTVYESIGYTPRVYDSDYDSVVFSRMTLFLNESDYDFAYDIDFDYKSWWNLYLSIGRSEIIQPDQVIIPVFDKFQPLGVLLDQVLPIKYQFGYDVSYPVLVTLRDPNAFAGDGYVFRFALESNVRQNMPVFESSDESSVQSQIPSSMRESVFCRRDNFNSGDIKIEVRSADSNQEIEGAIIEYNCGSDFCRIGQTSRIGNDIYFRGNFPVCAGGILEVSALGYETKLLPLSTELDVGRELNVIRLNPVFELDVNVKVFGLEKTGSSWAIDWNNPKELRSGESIFLAFEKLVDDPYDSEHLFISYLEGPGDNPDFTGILELVPGTYSVFGQLILDTHENEYLDPIIIPESKETICIGLDTPLGCVGDEKDIEFPEIEIGELFPQGMLFLDEDHGGSWEVSLDKLTNNNQVTFYIIASPYITQGLVLNHDDLEEFGKSDYYNAMNRVRLEPCFVGDGCP